MKKIIAFSILLTITTTSFSQQTEPVPTLTKQDYLKKSKSQKTVAVILSVTGNILITIGSAIYVPNALLYTITGGLAAIGSIPFYYNSKKNKRIAMSLWLNNNPVPELNNATFINRPGPSLNLKISL